MLHLSVLKYDDTTGTTTFGHEINTRVFESSLLNSFYDNAVLNILQKKKGILQTANDYF